MTVPMPGMKAGGRAASASMLESGADALVAIDEDAIAGFVAAATWDNFVGEELAAESASPSL